MISLVISLRGVGVDRLSIWDGCQRFWMIVSLGSMRDPWCYHDDRVDWPGANPVPLLNASLANLGALYLITSSLVLAGIAAVVIVAVTTVYSLLRRG